jgi:hypothetical protein
MYQEEIEPNITFAFSGEEITLSFSEVKRLKSILEKKFPEDYI